MNRPRLHFAVKAAVAGLIILTAAGAWQLRPFKQYPGVEYEEFPLPKDFNEKTEWTFARMMYPSVGGWGYRGNSDYKQGAANWTIDYPRSERHLTLAVRRLTRLSVRSVEQVVDLDEPNEVFDYPWMYAVELGYWNLTPQQIAQFREFLLRGGFFMCDDFHGTQEWNGFMRILQQVFPDRPVVDIPDADQIFHVVYDLDDRYQVPGAQYLYSRRRYEKDGMQARWRGVYDDHGRLMMAICHNVDLGDSWEWADVPQYPEQFSALGIRIATNYIIYSLTH